MEPEDSLPCSLEAAGLYPEPAESSQHFQPYFFKISLNSISSHLHLDLPAFRLKFCINFIFLHASYMSRPSHPLYLIILLRYSTRPSWKTPFDRQTSLNFPNGGSIQWNIVVRDLWLSWPQQFDMFYLQSCSGQTSWANGLRDIPGV